MTNELRAPWEAPVIEVLPAAAIALIPVRGVHITPRGMRHIRRLQASRTARGGEEP